MATRTRTSAKTRTMNPSRVQIQAPTPVDNDDDAKVKCSGHQMKCPRLRAGPTTKNAGRAFYCCPLPRDDPKRCKFFKWHDELIPSSSNTLGGPTTPSGGSTRAATLVNATNQTLGQSPQARYGRPLGSASTFASASNTTSASHAPLISGRTPTRPHPPVIEIDEDGDEDEDEMEEIDWDKVDADEMERVAIASTPGSSQPASQRTPTHIRTAMVTATSGTSLTDRLKDAAGDTLGKRSRDAEEDEGASSIRTPKRNLAATESNPFISSPSVTGSASNTATTPRSPPHSYLSPTLSSLEQLSEHLYRQDRLLRAAEQMKKGMRTTIQGLQERNKELEDRVKELEKRVGGK
ncbi:hypothetical protein IAU59_006669 [Kwoniella sp. CBS 9459]